MRDQTIPVCCHKFIHDKHVTRSIFRPIQCILPQFFIHLLCFLPFLPRTACYKTHRTSVNGSLLSPESDLTHTILQSSHSSKNGQTVLSSELHSPNCKSRSCHRISFSVPTVNVDHSLPHILSSSCFSLSLNLSKF